MADELDLDVLEEQAAREGQERNNIKDRFAKLTSTISEKEKLALQEAEARKKAEAERDQIAKERDFFKSFNTITSKYQGVGEYQDKVREKVLAGYDIEDAAISVLAKEGKFAPQAPKEEKESVTGGSAGNLPNIGAKKPISEMSQKERWEVLKGELG